MRFDSVKNLVFFHLNCTCSAKQVIWEVKTGPEHFLHLHQEQQENAMNVAFVISSPSQKTCFKQWSSSNSNKSINISTNWIFLDSDEF